MAGFKIKICGVTRAEDVEMISQCGADAIGINLVPTSPRSVTLDKARELTSLARSLGMQAVAVVMNMTAAGLAGVVEQVRPDALQLHGQELPDLLSVLSQPIPLIKAISWTGRAEEAALAERWQQFAMSGGEFAWLVDAYAPAAGGGTGKVARWDLIEPRPVALSQSPLLLAGGLTAANVAQAIAATHCSGVDTASGVESAPGIKDRTRVAAFVEQAKMGFAGEPHA